MKEDPRTIQKPNIKLIFLDQLDSLPGHTVIQHLRMDQRVLLSKSAQETHLIPKKPVKNHPISRRNTTKPVQNHPISPRNPSNSRKNQWEIPY